MTDSRNVSAPVRERERRERQRRGVCWEIPSGITRCWPRPMRAVSTASATYDSPSPSNRCTGIRWSSARLTTLEQSAEEREERQIAQNGVRVKWP
ncbi:hypothetical protein EYF80_031764 [Liparis tanakae]|uniref:Uncharacterized protein n=1 Tax=Liparis tanakae TaxID=230148 RepID=A0A4Z2GWW5_9TELE|nr:hypothetical protein EYF80_031764 [Liparis tanakae]